MENPGSEETPEAPNQMLCFNNQKFNPSLISFPVLTFLCVVFLILFPICIWHIRSANDFENHILKTNILLSSTILLPTVYFILNLIFFSLNNKKIGFITLIISKFQILKAYLWLIYRKRVEFIVYTFIFEFWEIKFFELLWPSKTSVQSKDGSTYL